MADRILVLNGMSYAKAVWDLGDITYDDDELIRQPKEFKLVLFTGGEDVTPELYNESSPKGQCWNNKRRDSHEMSVFQFALQHNIPMAGICRGLQFLNVMAGGRLMHHISGHGGGTHDMLVRAGRKVIHVNSLHHQMVIPSDNSVVIGVSARKLSNVYISDGDAEIDYYGQEVEAAIFPKLRAFGVQYHPEMMEKASDGYVFFHQMVINALTLDWGTFGKAYTEGLNDIPILEVHDAHNSVSG